ncbi:MAG: V-type ATP synthase subunit D [Candidatus Cloacimonetes bacterium]|nr:V-type ATP synthase subunit D [Candidatus Cloacimonadota bacterium]
MELKFQYNKTSLHAIRKQLKIREDALPTLKNKESALRAEVQKARDKAHELDVQIQQRFTELDKLHRIWSEFDPSLVSIKNVEIESRKIAGVRTPILKQIDYELGEFNMFNAPSWYHEGLEILKSLSQLQIERLLFLRKMHILDYVRKKTTQKVNLYEKAQIPAFNDAIRKIKRFLEDEETLSKAAQKILKNRMVKEAAS